MVTLATVTPTHASVTHTWTFHKPALVCVCVCVCWKKERQKSQPLFRRLCPLGCVRAVWMCFELWHLNWGLRSCKLLGVGYYIVFLDRSNRFKRLLKISGDLRHEARLVRGPHRESQSSRDNCLRILSLLFLLWWIIMVMTLLITLLLPAWWSIAVITPFTNCQKMGNNQSIFNFLGIKDPVVIYVNLIIPNKNQNQLPVTPTNTCGVE